MYYNLDYNNIENINLIQYSTPKQSSGGSYVSQVYYQNKDNTNVPIVLQTPEFDFNGINMIKNKPYIEIEYTPKTESFFKFFESLKEYNIEYAGNNSSNWFKKELSSEYLQDYHKSIVEVGENNKVIKMMLPFSKDKIDFDILEYNNNTLDIEQLYHRKIKCIIKIDNLKFLRQNLYLNLMVVKIQAQKENVIDLIKTGNTDNLEISKLDQSMINFND